VTEPHRTCGIPARSLPPCDDEWGHDGDLHSNAGDGFYAREYDEEHHRRQAERELIVETPPPPDLDAVERSAAGLLKISPQALYSTIAPQAAMQILLLLEAIPSLLAAARALREISEAWERYQCSELSVDEVLGTVAEQVER